MKSLQKNILLFILLICVALSACGENKKTSELIAYLEKMNIIADEEEVFITAYESATGDNYQSDLILYNKLDKIIIPSVSKVIKLAEDIEIKNPKLINIHEIYITAMNKQHQAFTMSYYIIESQDYMAVQNVNELLAEVRKLLRQYQTERKNLANEYGLELENVN